MTGILEQLVTDVASIKAMLNGGAGAPMMAPAPVDAFSGMTPAAPVQPVQITETHIMELITPYLENAAIKAALQTDLQALGIARLPDARPDQYAEMYRRFSATLAQLAGKATLAVAPPPTSII